MATLSVLILAKNEEKNIAACIRSVGFADEIIVIDSGSEDQTDTIAESLGARVIRHEMGVDGFAGQRNFALQQARMDWVLYLDADERILPLLAKEIKEHIGRQPGRAAALKRISVVMGQRMYYGVYRPDYVTRIFPRDKVSWKGIVHEAPESDLPVCRLHEAAEHICLTSWKQYFEKFTQYTGMMAKKMHQQGKKSGLFRMYGHAMYAFFQMYIIKKGFLDGRLGLLLCVYHFFYTLTKYVRLFYLDRHNVHIGEDDAVG